LGVKALGTFLAAILAAGITITAVVIHVTDGSTRSTAAAPIQSHRCPDVQRVVEQPGPVHPATLRRMLTMASRRPQLAYPQAIVGPRLVPNV
jgi:hypothetical protein